MSVRTASHLPVLGCCILLLIPCFTQGAPRTASSSSLQTSVSASDSPNQRLARSASELELDSAPNEGSEKEDCSADFVEKFFRVLSGPVGKEAEALVAAVLKLLSENDRINWSGLADQVRGLGMRPPHSPFSLHPPTSFITSSAQAVLVPAVPRSINDRKSWQSRLPDFTGAKRMAPKFNPTGWRRKRDADAAWQAVLERFLKQYEETPVSVETSNKPSALFDEDDINGDLSPENAEWSKVYKHLVPENAEWGKAEKRNEVRLFRRLESQLKPKRKPLEFNPTGW